MDGDLGVKVKAFAIGPIGSGNAAEAIIASLLAGGWCAAEQVLVSDPNVARLKQIADTTGIRAATSNEQVAGCGVGRRRHE